MSDKPSKNEAKLDAKEKFIKQSALPLPSNEEVCFDKSESLKLSKPCDTNNNENSNISRKIKCE